MTVESIRPDFELAEKPRGKIIAEKTSKIRTIQTGR
jgi:hypothetical protein